MSDLSMHSEKSGLDRRPVARPVETCIGAALLLLLLWTSCDSLPHFASAPPSTPCVVVAVKMQANTMTCVRHSDHRNS